MQKLARRGEGRQGDLPTIRTRCTDRSALRAPWPTFRGDAPPSGRRRRRSTRCKTASRCCSASGRRTCASSSRGVRAATASTGPTPCRTTPPCCPRRSAGRSACSLTRKDEMAWENYGARLRHRPARRPRRRRQHRRLGLRVVVAHARRPSRERAPQATSSPACWPASSRRPFAPRTPAPEPAGIQQRQQRRAVVRHRLRGRPVRRHAARSAASAS